MLVDDPKDYEELHEMALDQELCIHITEDMLTMSPDQTNGYSGSCFSEKRHLLLYSCGPKMKNDVQLNETGSKEQDLKPECWTVNAAKSHKKRIRRIINPEVNSNIFILSLQDSS